jgi:uncharacterized protein (TIGR00251 family)
MPIKISQTASVVSFSVRVQPRASRDEIGGEWLGALKVRLTAPPIDDRANEALCRLFSQRLNVPLAAVTIAAGARATSKSHEKPGVTPEQIKKLAGNARKYG